ncbi:MAG: IS110 family transposase [Vicinamibacterales bacterium]
MEKHYIGVDLQQAFFQACAVTATGEPVWEQRFPRTADGMAALLTRCTRQTAIAVEASTPTWHFADVIAPQVGELRVVDSVKTKLKAGYAAKTDRLDARRLADALRRDSVVGIYYPPPAIRDLRELCRGRHTLVQTRTRIVQRIRAVLLRHGLVDARRLVRRDAGLETLDLPPRAAASVTSLRRVLVVVRAEITAVERDVQTLAATDPVAIRLQQIPGIGPVLALLIRAEIGDLRRFPTPAHLASYAGLVPRVDASAGRYRYGRITRRGSPWLRWALVEAALHAPRRHDPVGRWARRLAIRKGALKARVACARSLCTDIFAAWLASA